MANNNLEIILSLKDELTSGLKKASKDLDTFATNMKNVGRDLSQVGGTIALFGGTLSGPFVLALKNASKTSVEVKNSLENLNSVTTSFQRDIAQAVVPIVQRFTNVLVDLYDRFLQIPEPIRTSILQATMLAGVFLTLGGGIAVITGKIIGLISNVASLTSAFIAFSVANPVLLGVVATVGILIALMFKFKAVADFVLNSFEVFFNTLKAGFLTVKSVNEEFIASIALGLSKVIAGYASLGLAGSETMTNMANDLAMVAGDFKVFATRDVHEAKLALEDIGQIIATGEGDWSNSFEKVKAKVFEWTDSLKGVGQATDQAKIDAINNAEEVRKGYEKIVDEISRIPKMFGDSFGQAIVYGKSFTESLKESFKSMAANIISQIIQMVIQMTIFDKLLDTIKSKLESSSKKKGFGSIFGGIAGSLFGGVGSIVGSLAGSFFHSGGIIKAHNGLAVDEVPIIAQTGEGVLSRRGMQALGGNNALNSLNRGVGIQGNTSINIYINNANMNSEKGISDTAEMLGFEIERNLRLARGI